MASLVFKKTSRVFTKNSVTIEGKYQNVPSGADVTDASRVILTAVENDSMEKYSLVSYTCSENNDFTVVVNLPEEVPTDSVNLVFTIADEHTLTLALPKKERQAVNTTGESAEESSSPTEEQNGQQTPEENSYGNQGTEEGTGATENSQTQPEGNSEGQGAPVVENTQPQASEESGSTSGTESESSGQSPSTPVAEFPKEIGRTDENVPIMQLDADTFNVGAVYFRKNEFIRPWVPSDKATYTVQVSGNLINRVGSKVSLGVITNQEAASKDYTFEFIEGPENMHTKFKFEYNTDTDTLDIEVKETCVEAVDTHVYIRYQVVYENMIAYEGRLELAMYDSSLIMPVLLNNYKLTNDEQGKIVLDIQKHEFGVNFVVPVTLDYPDVLSYEIVGLPKTEPSTHYIKVIELPITPARKGRYSSILQIRPVRRCSFYIKWKLSAHSGAVAELVQAIGITGKNPEPVIIMTDEERAEEAIFGGTPEDRKKYLCYQSLRRDSRFDVYPYKFKYDPWTRLDLDISITGRDKYAMFWVLKNAFMKFPMLEFICLSTNQRVNAKNFLDFLKKWKSKYPYDDVILPPYSKTVGDWAMNGGR